MPKERHAFRTGAAESFGHRASDADLTEAAAETRRSGRVDGRGQALSGAEARLVGMAGHVSDAKSDAVRAAQREGLPLSGSPEYSCHRCDRGFACLRDLSSHLDSGGCLSSDYLLHSAPYDRGDGGVLLRWGVELGPSVLGARLGVGSQGLRLLRAAQEDARRITSKLGVAVGGMEPDVAESERCFVSPSVRHDATMTLTLAPQVLFIEDSARAMVAQRATVPPPVVGVPLPAPHRWAIEFAAEADPDGDGGGGSEGGGGAASSGIDAGFGGFAAAPLCDPAAYSTAPAVAAAARRSAQARASGASQLPPTGAASPRRMRGLSRRGASRLGVAAAGSRVPGPASSGMHGTASTGDYGGTFSEGEAEAAAALMPTGAVTPFSSGVAAAPVRVRPPRKPRTAGRRRKTASERLTPMQRAGVEARGARALLRAAGEWEQTDEDEEDEDGIVIEDGRVHDLRG